MASRLIFLHRLVMTKTRWGDGELQVGRRVVVPVRVRGDAAGKSAATVLGDVGERFGANPLKALPGKTSSESLAVRTGN
jgi:hypothetical protein